MPCDIHCIAAISGVHSNHVSSQVQHCRDRVRLTRNVVFDLSVVASRLEALQHGWRGGTESGPCKGFRAQIRPDSSAAAEEELRREIR